MSPLTWWEIITEVTKDGWISDGEVKALNDLLDDWILNWADENKTELWVTTKKEIDNNTVKSLLTEITTNNDFFTQLKNWVKKDNSPEEYQKLLSLIGQYWINQVNDTNIKEWESAKIKDDWGDELANIQFDETVAVRTAIEEIQVELNGLKSSIENTDLTDNTDNNKIDQALSWADKPWFDQMINSLSWFTFGEAKSIDKDIFIKISDNYSDSIVKLFQEKFWLKYTQFSKMTWVKVIRIWDKMSFVKLDNDVVKILDADDNDNPSSWVDASTLTKWFWWNAEKQKDCPPWFKFVDLDWFIESFSSWWPTLKFIKNDLFQTKDWWIYDLSDPNDPKQHKTKVNNKKYPVKIDWNWKMHTVIDWEEYDVDWSWNAKRTEWQTNNKRIASFQDWLDAFSATIDKFMPYLTQISLMFKKMFNSDSWDESTDWVEYQLATLEWKYLAKMNEDNAKFYRDQVRNVDLTNQNYTKQQIQLSFLKLYANKDNAEPNNKWSSPKDIFDEIVKNWAFDDSDINLLVNNWYLKEKVTPTPKVDIWKFDKKVTTTKNWSIVIDWVIQDFNVNNPITIKDSKGNDRKITQWWSFDEWYTYSFEGDNENSEDADGDSEVEVTETEQQKLIKNLEWEKPDFGSWEDAIVKGGVYITKGPDNNSCFLNDFKGWKKYPVPLVDGKIPKASEDAITPTWIAINYDELFNYKEWKVGTQIPAEAFKESTDLCKWLLKELVDTNALTEAPKTQFNTTTEAKTLVKSMLAWLTIKYTDNSKLKGFWDVTSITESDWVITFSDWTNSITSTDIEGIITKVATLR